MRLVVLTEDFYPHTSGGAHIRWRFCQLATERGHEITVFTPHERGLPHKETTNGVKIRRPFRVKPAAIPVYSPIALVTRIVASIVLFIYLCWWFRGHEIDGLYSASHLTHWMGTGISLLYSIPLISFIGYTPSVDPSPSLTPKLVLERINFRLFMGDLVFCQTPRVKRVIDKRADATTSVLHGILDSQTLSRVASGPNVAQTKSELSGTVLVYVGRLVPVKNPIGAIEMLSQLPEEYSLLMVGGGSERTAVESTAQAQDVEARVQICGELPHEETLATIASADALVLSSHEESYPTVVFEALSFSKDVFATPVGILPTIEHPRLHVDTLENLHQTILQTTLGSENGLDAETMGHFSMEQHTDDILDAFERLFNC